MSLTVILVRPQLSSNIGSIARVMKNFALSELRLVMPRDGWNDEAAFALASGADDILNQATIFSDLHSAVADITLLLATTARSRYINKPVIEVQDLSGLNTKKIGLLFGPENSGLSNEDLVLANQIINISTNSVFSSLNIVQAAAIIFHSIYEKLPSIKNNSKASPCASKEELINFFNHLEHSLDQSNFFKIQEKRADMLRNIKNIFSRIEGLSSQEISSLHGVITALSKK